MPFTSALVQSIQKANNGDFANMRESFEENEIKLQALNPLMRSLRNQLSYALHELHDGAVEVSGPLLEDVFVKVDAVLEIVGDDIVLREGWISDILDLMAKTRAFQFFLSTGRLLPPTDHTLTGGGREGGRVRDEEYLGGVMGLSQELSRHAIKRASALDVAAVARCRDLLTILNGKLLEFEFRNGGLRRKYDGVKWGLRRMEDLLYELSVVGVFPPSSPPSSLPPSASSAMETEEGKEDKDNGVIEKDEEDAVVPLAALEGIRLRLSSFDEHRELIIKACRDIQKASKNAIYSTHRSDFPKAHSLLSTARLGMKQALRPSLLLHPSLRHTGSVESALEEFAEAVLFLVWREEGRLATREEVGEGEEGGMEVTPIEYIGGLVDLTGEVGRLAVARATERDVAAVEGCLETVMYVGGELVRTTLPGKVNKKMEGLRTNQKKLETLRYELALIQAGKGRVGGMEGAKEGGEGGEGGGKEKEEE